MKPPRPGIHLDYICQPPSGGFEMGFSQVWPLKALPKPHKLGSRNKIRLRKPRREESVSKLVSEPGAVAMGSNNSAKLDDRSLPLSVLTRTMNAWASGKRKSRLCSI